MMHEEVANVLEKLATYIETMESAKTAEIQAERTSVAKELAAKISSVTGETMDDETVDKLARADKDILITLGKLANETNSESLGGPAEKRNPNAAMTSKEASAAADENLLNFILSA
jgi:hypothetical protein